MQKRYNSVRFEINQSGVQVTGNIHHGVQRRMISVVIFSYFLDYYCFVVAIFDLVHDVEIFFTFFMC